MGRSYHSQRHAPQAILNRQSWALTLICKDMTISVKDTTVFSVFHPDAQDLYNACSDLKKVAWGLWDPNRRLGNEVFRPDPRSNMPLTIRRTKGCISSEHSPPCFAGDLRNSRKVLKRCKEKPSSSKRSSTENVSNYTSAATSSFIVRGVYKISGAPRVADPVVGRAKTIRTFTEVTRV